MNGLSLAAGCVCEPLQMRMVTSTTTDDTTRTLQRGRFFSFAKRGSGVDGRAGCVSTPSPESTSSLFPGLLRRHHKPLRSPQSVATLLPLTVVKPSSILQSVTINGGLVCLLGPVPLAISNRSFICLQSVAFPNLHSSRVYRPTQQGSPPLLAGFAPALGGCFWQAAGARVFRGAAKQGN